MHTMQCAGHHSALVWPRACRTALCVMGQVSLGWAAWGEFGLRTSCPGWTEDTSGVPWCHRGTPPTHTVVQCNHSQSERIHEFIPVQVRWASANKPPLFILSFGGKSFSTESKAPTFKLCLVFSKVESFGILVCKEACGSCSQLEPSFTARKLNYKHREGCI